MRKVMILYTVCILLCAYFSPQSSAQQLEIKELLVSNIGVNVGEIEEANIKLYADVKGDYLKNFQLNFDEQRLKFPSWKNVSNQTYYPKLFYSDLNSDGLKDLVIILTLGYGTGVIEQEVHVLHDDGEHIYEIPVQNPKEIIEKNVKTKITPSQVIITIHEEKQVKMDIKNLGIDTKDLFSSVVTANLIRYDVINNKLTAIIGAQVAPVGGYIGDFIITYRYKDDKYRLDKIDFKPIAN
ncbi:hypothetical protein [Sutcliffiella horikoshii]|uniref:hypothetical protein n=1 Tax=Sutcliffiella horikoshii TaxID=79883 RepID=UPI001CFE6847|nr:hypothetical protein [Sutcliffiella horikoshii]